MLVIGTSATVQPAAYIPVICKESGAKVIEINAEPTPLTQTVSDYLIRGQAGQVTTRIVSELERLLAAQ
jgi:NAD-dependent deacetylase